MNWRAVSHILWQWSAAVSGLLLLTGCGLGLPDDEATWVLKDLAAVEKPSHLKDITPAPERQQIFYTIEDRSYQADLYIPAQPPLAALVLVPGLAEAGKNDPRLKSFATTLARVRFLVLVPDLPNLRALKVKEEDVQGLVDTFEYMQSLPQASNNIPSGIGAFSYAAGPAVLAALNASICEQVNFVLGVGGYYDLNQVIRFFTTGYFRRQGEWQYLEPNRYGKWVFILSNVDLLRNADDRRILRTIAKHKLRNPEAQNDELKKQLMPAAQVDDLEQQLTPEGESVLALIENRDPALSQSLIAKLPAEIRAQLEALNIASQDLSQLEAQLILLHGTDDTIIPYTESIALSKAVPADQFELFLIDGLAHVDLHPLKLDRQAAWRAITAILAQRKNAEEE
ncbi:hypothetical protein [Methylophaga sp. OBS4]|uniref:hypothetical protein n=1 Tax=Methylophaga sp. OBS4 TaxID=2991935 RepID=UPI0022522B28|nr:hypothetical protein [Methylophaga sp. OBS4]MCX4186530.1 lysophospholipase [Methylophaga sp. OBS4]